jgi:hypothetical protein
MYATGHAAQPSVNPLDEFAQIPYDPADYRPRRSTPPMQRWWCEPAVKLTHICIECYNTKAPGEDRCHYHITEQRLREERRAAHIEDLYERRGQAFIDGDLATALQIDDTLECVYGMHGDERMTCYQCQSWFGHAHHPITNEIMTSAEWDAYTAARPGIYGRR